MIRTYNELWDEMVEIPNDPEVDEIDGLIKELKRVYNFGLDDQIPLTFNLLLDPFQTYSFHDKEECRNYNIRDAIDRYGFETLKFSLEELLITKI